MTRLCSWPLLAVVLFAACDRVNEPEPSDRSASPSAEGGSGGESASTEEPEIPPAPPPQWPEGCEHPEVVANCEDGWCRIPAGCFVMGSPEDEWARGRYGEEQATVTFTRSFEVQQHEMTQEEWTKLEVPNPSGENEHGADCSKPNCPVGNITWYDAAAFANLLSERHDPPLDSCYQLDECEGAIGEGLVCESASSAFETAYDCPGYRLPTEAEWEYAARAGTQTAFYTGPITEQEVSGECYFDPALDVAAWYCFNSEGQTHPVGQKLPNGWGLYDMLGNAWEWVHGGSFNPRPFEEATDPLGELDMDRQRVLRGGLYNSASNSCKAAKSLGFSGINSAPGVGFRLARTLPPE